MTLRALPRPVRFTGLALVALAVLLLLVRGLSGGEEPQDAARPAATTPGLTPTAPTTDARPRFTGRYARLVIAPLVRVAADPRGAEKRIGGTAKTLAPFTAIGELDEAAQQFDQADVTLQSGAEPFLRIARLDPARAPFADLHRFFCSGIYIPASKAQQRAYQRGVTRLAQAAQRMNAQVVLGLRVDLTTYEGRSCAYPSVPDPGRVTSAVEAFADRGVTLAMDGWSAGPADRSVAAVQREFLRAKVRIAAPTPDAVTDPLQVALFHLRAGSRRSLAIADIDAVGGPLRRALEQTARAGADAFLVDSRSPADTRWQQVAPILEELADEDPAIKRRLDSALRRVRAQATAG